MTMPTSRPTASTTVVMPRRLAVISSSACFMVARLGDHGHGLAGVHEVLHLDEGASIRASPPDAGRRSPRGAARAARAAAMASASPMARAAVVLEVGARFMGQASSRTPTSSTTSACRASEEAALPVRSTSGTPEPLHRGQHRQQLVGLARVGQRHDHVVPRHHAHVAVHALRRGGGSRPACPCSPWWPPPCAPRGRTCPCR